MMVLIAGGGEVFRRKVQRPGTRSSSDQDNLPKIVAKPVGTLVSFGSHFFP